MKDKEKPCGNLWSVRSQRRETVKPRLPAIMLLAQSAKCRGSGQSPDANARRRSSGGASPQPTRSRLFVVCP